MLIQLLKRFEGWGTALQNKFRIDLFFRTTLYIIALQTVLTLVSLATFSWILSYTNNSVASAFATYIAQTPTAPATLFSPVLPATIDAIQNNSIQYVFVSVTAAGIIFAILLVYVTLRPARRNLEYQKLFISNVAHELRTPLSTIKTSTEVALLDPTLPKNARSIFIDTVGELDRLSEIIDNLLSLNQFLRPERMEFGNIDLGAVVDTAVRHIRPLANQRTVELQVKKHDYRLVWGNATALEQVVGNLVKNAVNYIPRTRQGIVVVSVQPDYLGSVVLQITDNGIGIEQKDLFHIFEPFYRADKSRTRVRRDGSGLGLAIVNEIVRMHRGKIHIQSALDKGTVVSVTLPAGTTPPGQDPDPAATQKTFNEISIDFSAKS